MDKSINFTKYITLDQLFDCENEIYLREYRNIFLEKETNEWPLELEYFLWDININITHIRKSDNILIDSTFHFPYGFGQSMVKIYKDIITSEKYPPFYILMNKKNFALYNLVIK